MVKGPQTARDALLAELLADVTQLLDRVEALGATVPAAMNAASSKNEREAQRLRQSLRAEQAGLIAEISELVGEVRGIGWHLSLKTLAAGFVGGVLGGLLVWLLLT